MGVGWGKLRWEAMDRQFCCQRNPAHAPRRTTVKITDVDIIPAHVPLAARNAAHAVRFRSIDQRTFFKVQTDNGLVGWGEYRCTPPSAQSVEGLIGRSP